MDVLSLRLESELRFPASSANNRRVAIRKKRNHRDRRGLALSFFFFSCFSGIYVFCVSLSYFCQLRGRACDGRVEQWIWRSFWVFGSKPAGRVFGIISGSWRGSRRRKKLDQHRTTHGGADPPEGAGRGQPTLDFRVAAFRLVRACALRPRRGLTSSPDRGRTSMRPTRLHPRPASAEGTSPDQTSQRPAPMWMLEVRRAHKRLRPKRSRSPSLATCRIGTRARYLTADWRFGCFRRLGGWCRKPLFGYPTWSAASSNQQTPMRQATPGHDRARTRVCHNCSKCLAALHTGADALTKIAERARPGTGGLGPRQPTCAPRRHGAFRIPILTTRNVGF